MAVDIRLTVTNRKGYPVVASALVVSAAIVAVAIVFASSVGGSNISTEALAYTRTESAIAALATSQGAIQRSVAIAQADPAQREMVLEAASMAVLTSRDRVQQLDRGLSPETAADAIAYFDVAVDVLDLVDRGDFDQAAGLVTGDLASEYATLLDRLLDRRDGLGSALQSMDDRAAAAATATRFVIALAIPLIVGVLALGTYRRRESQRILQEQVEYERDLRKSRDDFIANVSHELRTPLTAVFGFAQLLDAGLIESREERDDLIRLIYGESGELVRMVEDLLTAARLTEGELAYKLEAVDVATEVEDVIEVLTRLGTDIAILGVEGHVRADRLRFRQIVRNLLANAARYGGETVVVTGTKAGDMYRLVVADNGSGVQDETVDTMFERFSHYEDASLARGGLGLGLSIVRTLLEDMAGTIRYERVDGWSRFVVELPVAVSIRGTVRDESMVAGA